jgi:hypothetical protein
MNESSTQSSEAAKLLTLDEDVDLSAPDVRHQALETIWSAGLTVPPAPLPERAWASASLSRSRACTAGTSLYRTVPAAAAPLESSGPRRRTAGTADVRGSTRLCSREDPAH